MRLKGRGGEGGGVQGSPRQRCIRTADKPGRRGGGVPPPPPPWARISWGEDMKFTKENIDLGYFWYTDFRVPDPPPPAFLTHPGAQPCCEKK